MQYKYSLPVLLSLFLPIVAMGQNVPNTQTAPAGTVNTFTPPPAMSPGADPNYIRTYVPVLPQTDGANITPSSPASQVRQAVEYKDGFNRTFQAIQFNAATVDGQPKHVVQVSDNRPQRESRGFLPYATTNSNIQYDPFAAQKAYYQSLYPDEGYTSFSRSINSSNTLERSSASYAPGKSQVGQERKTISKKISNIANQVRIWGLDANGLPVSTGYYAANQLFGEETTLPDAASTGTMTSGIAPKTRVYNDKDGRMVLKMVADSTYAAVIGGTMQLVTGYQSTYYVYDEMGRLRYTLPPRAVQLIEANSWVVTQTVRDNLCFQYRFDQKGRPVATKTPGESGFSAIVYDRRQMPVMSRSANDSVAGKWNVTFYDQQGRVKATSVFTDANTAHNQAWWQQQVDAYAGSSTADLLYYLATDAGIKLYPAENAVANNLMMTYTWYDRYDFVDPGGTLWATYDNYFQLTPELLTTEGAETPVRSLRTQGMVTGSKTRIIPSTSADPVKLGTWSNTILFYDDKGRVIYTISGDQYGSNTPVHARYTGMQYDFAGRVLLSKHIMVNNSSVNGPVDHTERTRNEYDMLSGSLVKTWHKVDNGGWNVISSFAYDDLGRVKRKILGNGGEVQDYNYNIRGQLTGVNDLYTRTGAKEGVSRTYGEVLRYDYGFSQPRYDGKIGGMLWRGADALNTYAYGYDYDMSGRLKRADYRTSSNGGGWNNTGTDYSVSNLFYDKNGNIKSMNQRGVKPGTGPVNMDILSYSYEAGGQSNRLASVTDAGVADYGAGDFKDVGGTTDYTYDANGNIKLDQNKGIATVDYNRFNKPVLIKFGNGNRIEYSYDATGNKVQELATSISPAYTKRTDYIGNFVYQGDTLQYILTGEGRTAFDNQTANPVKEEFFVKDHLGNVRSVVDVITYSTQQYLATFEVASANLEGLFFDDMQQVRDDKPGSTNPDDLKSGNLNGADPERRVGTSLLLKVMAGDKVDMKVNNYYENFNGEDDQQVSMEDMLGTVLNTLTEGAGGFVGSESHNAELVSNVFSMPNYSTFHGMVEQQTDPSRPKAYLNYMLFDERMELVQEMSGAFQANGNGSWTEIGTTAPVEVPVNGYLAVYLSNHSQQVSCFECGNTFFDQVKVTVSKGNLLEESHYYPFGLPINGMGSTAVGFKENRRKYQSNEYIKDLGLNWMDFQARQYDPQIGRFLGVDPRAAQGGQDMYSPYAAMGNAPESMIDPNGEQFAPTTFTRPSYGIVDNEQDESNIQRIMNLGSKGYDNSGAGFVGGGGSSWGTGCNQSARIAFWQNVRTSFDATTGNASIDVKTGLATNVLPEVVVTGEKKPGFFGKAWTAIKKGWNNFGQTVGGAMDDIHNWMNRKLGHEADVRRDKTYDKDGGGYMLTGKEGGYGEGRSVDHSYGQINVDEMGFMFSYFGGSEYDLPGSFVAELIERSDEIYGRFTDGNGILDFMKSEPRQTYLPGSGISPCPNGDCLILDTAGHNNTNFKDDYQRISDSMWGPRYEKL